MDELRQRSATEIARGVGNGELDPVEVVEAHLRALDEHAALNAVITTCADQALDRARAGLAGPLAGVPLIVKDLFDTAGVRTTYGSSIYAGHVPERTAPAVSRLEAAGAVVIAKANLHEFAWGITSQNDHFGYVQNPVRPGLVAGGSSGGNAAALAAHLGALGLGSDTGGSVRIPSACCRTVGFKPSLGSVPLEGCLPLSPAFDTGGAMARTVADCALATAVLTGAPLPQHGVAGLVVGVLEETPGAHRLEALGARLVPARLPEPVAEIMPLFMVEAAVAHRETFPSRREEYGANVRVKWDAASKVTGVELYEAQRALLALRERARSEPAVDLVVSPTLGMEVPPIDCWEPDVRVAMTRWTRPFNFLGWPAIAIGDVQIAGRDDAKVLAAALAWEEAYGPPA